MRACTVTVLGCFGGAFNSDNGLLVSCLNKMSDMLSDEFSGLLYATAQYAFARTAYNRRAGATPRNFGRLRAHKMGSLPPGLVLFLRHFSHSRVVYFLVSRDLCASQR